MTQPQNPIRAGRRRTEALEQLGTDQPCCLYCGSIDHLVVRRRRIADHHMFGRERDPLTVPVCLNCHAGAHEGLRDSDVPMIQEQEPTKFARAIFSALAVHFSLLAKACWRFAKRMDK